MEHRAGDRELGVIKVNTALRVLEVRLLGQFEVVRNGTRIPDHAWRRRKAKSFLALLLSQPGHVFSYDVLIDWLFKEADPERARSSLYALVSQLRRTLEPDLKRGNDSTYVVRRGEGYFFDAESPCWIDILEFVKHVNEGEERCRTGDPLNGVAAYEEAIRLYRGDFLEADRYEEWTLEPREQWLGRYILALTRLADGYANLGDYKRAAAACREAFNLQPWRDSVVRQLMAYHHMAGEQAEALHVYKKGVEALRRELDVGPAPETEELRRAVLEESSPGVEIVRDRTRIAVLPLVNLGSDPEDELFTDGMTEELIYSLAKVDDLKVIAQTSSLSYKNTKKTVAQIGRELSIGSLIEGSVRRAGDGLRVMIQLIDVSTEEHLWAQEYDRELRDAFSIQSEIAREVAGALRVELLAKAVERLEEQPTANLEAYTLYLKGRHFLKATDGRPADITQGHAIDIPRLREAITCFEAAIEADPSYSLAWSGLADALCLLWFFSDLPVETLERAEGAANRAVLQSPHSGEGYASQALVQWIGRKEVTEAWRLLERAVRLSPKNPTIHRWLARILRQLGRRGEALVEMLRELETNPLSPTANLELADLHLDAGRHEDAIQHVGSVLELDPSDVIARLRLAKFKMLAWDWEGAEAEYVKAIADSPKDAFPVLQYAELLLSLGRRAEGEAALKRGLALAGTPCPPRILGCIGVLYYLLEDFERALQCFQQEIAQVPRIRKSYWWSGICHWRLGHYEEALAWLETGKGVSDGFFRLSRDDAALGLLWARGLVYSTSGDRDKARAVIAAAKENFSQGMPRRSLGIAAIYFHLGELDEGFVWLRKAVEERCPNLQRIRGYGLPEAVTRDPRYTEILGPTGLTIAGG